jgi:hypothetical protein
MNELQNEIVRDAWKKIRKSCYPNAPEDISTVAGIHTNSIAAGGITGGMMDASFLSNLPSFYDGAFFLIQIVISYYQMHPAYKPITSSINKDEARQMIHEEIQMFFDEFKNNYPQIIDRIPNSTLQQIKETGSEEILKRVDS